MRLLLIFDSFKDSLSSEQAARQFAKGWSQIRAHDRIGQMVMSDGGEGFLDAMAQDGKASRKRRRVTGPLGETQTASWLSRPGRCAVIEMAQAAGLEQVPLRKRNPLRTTSHGVGELIRAALDDGARRIILGLGGSATVDGGIGMAAALGAQFLDQSGRPLSGALTGASLSRIGSLNLDALHPALARVEIQIAADVTNTLCGRSGAARIFGPQKGATPAGVKQLEDGLENLADILARDTRVRVRRLAGGGAAGGISAMLHALSGAEIMSGAGLVLDTMKADAKMGKADLVITGEGSLDSQSVCGKTVAAIISRCASLDTPVMAVAGRVDDRGIAPFYQAGLKMALPLCTGPMTLEESMANAPSLMMHAGTRLARLV